MLEIFTMKRGFKVIEPADWNTMSAWALDTLNTNAHTAKVSTKTIIMKKGRIKKDGRNNNVVVLGGIINVIVFI